MNTFDDKYCVLADAQFAIGEQTLACGEVKSGELYLLATEQSIELGIEKGEVYGIKRLEVIIPRFVERSLFAVYKIVIE